MPIIYEWTRETVDPETGDILDTAFADDPRDVWPTGANDRLALVRTTGDDVRGITDRMWAYADAARMLPAEFTYCGAEPGEADPPNGVRVPQRFHRQIARAAAG